MAKFNKDRFINMITEKVQSAINKHLLSNEDYDNNETTMLHKFIQYELTEYIEDRKFALDVLSDFNYDERVPWEELEKEFGTFKTLMDIALINLWKFVQSEGADDYKYYKRAVTDIDTPLLDIVRDDEKFDPNNDDVMDNEIDNYKNKNYLGDEELDNDDLGDEDLEDEELDNDDLGDEDLDDEELDNDDLGDEDSDDEDEIDDIPQRKFNKYKQ
jgi:hypothetical protein